MENRPKFNGKIPDLIKDIAAASSAINRNANRTWIIAATLTLLIVGSYQNPDENVVEFIGFKFAQESFFPISALLLIIVNIAYCSAHIQGYRISETFRKVIDNFDPTEEIDGDGKKKPIELNRREYVAESVTLNEVSYMLLMPNFNRIHPIFISRTKDGNALWYRLVKVITDTVYLSVPWIGICAAIWASREIQFLFLFFPALILSAYSSLALASYVIKFSLGGLLKASK